MRERTKRRLTEAYEAMFLDPEVDIEGVKERAIEVIDNSESQVFLLQKALLFAEVYKKMVHRMAWQKPREKE